MESIGNIKPDQCIQGTISIFVSANSLLSYESFREKNTIFRKRTWSLSVGPEACCFSEWCYFQEWGVSEIIGNQMSIHW